MSYMSKEEVMEEVLACIPEGYGTKEAVREGMKSMYEMGRREGYRQACIDYGESRK